MARLSQAMKTYVVTRLACFATPTEVVEDVKEAFGIEITRQQVQHYNAGTPGSKTPKKWRILYHATREEWVKAAAECGVAHDRYRLEELQRLYNKAKRMGQSGNIPLAMSILEQAAKEVGGAFTNRHKVTHDGQVKTTGVLVVPQGSDGDWSQRAREQQKKLEEEAAAAAKAESGG